MNEYKMTFNALNMAAKDLERKLPIFAPFQTVDEQKQLVMLVSFFPQSYTMISPADLLTFLPGPLFPPTGTYTSEQPATTEIRVRVGDDEEGSWPH